MSSSSSSSPQESSSWYEWIFFSWVSPIVTKGGERESKGEQLLISDIAKLPSIETAKRARDDFHKFWDATNTKNDTAPNLYDSFISFQKRPLVISGVFRFLSDAFRIASPFILREFCIYIFEPSTPTWEGWLWIVALALCAFIGSLCGSLSAFYCQQAFETMRSVLKILVFDKALEYESNHEFVGELTTAHASDTDKVFGELAHWYHLRWSSPIFAGELLAALAVIAGPQSLLLLPILLVVVVVQAILITSAFSRKELYMNSMDKRTGLLSELLQAIRVIKCQGWETAFEESITAVRDEEVHQIGKIRVFIVMAMIFTSLLTYGMYLGQYGFIFEFEIDLTPQVAFPSLALVGQLSFPLVQAAIAMGYTMDAKLALSRIQKCLIGREKQEYVLDETTNLSANIGDESDREKYVAEIKNVCVLGSLKEKKKIENDDANEEANDAVPEREILAENLSLKIHRGKLTMVIGSCGSGKTLLCSTLLGETTVDLDAMFKATGQEEDRGFVRHYEKIAYVPQEKYLTNATVRENITLVREEEQEHKSSSPSDNDHHQQHVDEERYQRTLRVCQLTSDLSRFQFGDKTEIGTSGSSVSISGGQAQRISIARACYSNRELCVFDCCLEALDPQVAKSLFEECIMGVLMKEKKSILFVTHNTQFLSRANRIVVMNDCQVAFDGTFEEFKAEGFDVDEEDNEQEEEEKEKNQTPKTEQERNNEPEITTSKLEEVRTEVDREQQEQKQQQHHDSSSIPSGLLVPETNEPQSSIPATKTKLHDVAGGATQIMTNEDRQSGSISASTYLWYFAGGGYVPLIAMTLLVFLSFTCNSLFNITLAAWSTKQQYDVFLRGSSSNRTNSDDQLRQQQQQQQQEAFTLFKDFTNDREYLSVMGLLFAISAVFHLLRSVPVYLFYTNASRFVHAQLLHSVVASPMQWIETVPIARILNRFSSDIVALDFQVGDQVLFCINLFAIMWGFILVMSVSNPLVLVALVLLLCYFGLCFVSYAKVARGCKRLEAVSRTPMMSLMSELTSPAGLPSIRVYGIQHQLKARHVDKVELSTTPIYNMRILDRWLTMRTEIVGVVIVIVIGGLGVLGRHLRDGESGSLSSTNDNNNAGNNGALRLTPGLVCVALAMALEAGPLLSALTRHFSMLETEMNATERLKEYSDSIPQETRMKYNCPCIVDEKKNEPIHELQQHQHQQQKQLMVLTVIPSTTSLPPPSPSWPSSPSVEFKNVSMRYRPGLPLVLKNVSFNIHPGQRVGLCGASGGSKSTIFATLMRLVEISSGEILIDGRDITRELDVRDLRKSVIVVSQDPVLFSGTLRKNLDMFGEHTDAVLWEMLEKVGMKRRFEEDNNNVSILRSQRSGFGSSSLSPFGGLGHESSVQKQQQQQPQASTVGTIINDNSNKQNNTKSPVLKGTHHNNATPTSRALAANNHRSPSSSSSTLRARRTASSGHYGSSSVTQMLNRNPSSPFASSQRVVPAGNVHSSFQMNRSSSLSSARARSMSPGSQFLIPRFLFNIHYQTHNNSNASSNHQSLNSLSPTSGGNLRRNNNNNNYNIADGNHQNNSSQMMRNKSNNNNNRSNGSGSIDFFSKLALSAAGGGSASLAGATASSPSSQRGFPVVTSASHSESDFHYLDGVQEMMNTTILDLEKMRREEMIMEEEREEEENEENGKKEEDEDDDDAETNPVARPPKNRRHTLQHADFGGELMLDSSFHVTGLSDSEDSEEESGLERSTNATTNTTRHIREKQQRRRQQKQQRRELFPATSESAEKDAHNGVLIQIPQQDERDNKNNNNAETDSDNKINLQVLLDSSSPSNQKFFNHGLRSSSSSIFGRSSRAKGLDTIIEQGAANLSVGERSLMCLCRALLRAKTRTLSSSSPSIVLFDEITSACNSETSEVIHRVIRSELTGFTTITIAHKLESIIDSDLIIVMNQGRVYEQGSPAELLQKENDGVNFRSMIEALGLTKFEKLRSFAFASSPLKNK